MGVGLEALKGWSVVNAKAMMAVDRLDRDNDLLATLSFSTSVSRDTTLPWKVQRTLGFIQIKAVLGLLVAVNEKSQRRYSYTQLSASKRPPQTGTVYFITTYLCES